MVKNYQNSLERIPKSLLRYKNPERAKKYRADYNKLHPFSKTNPERYRYSMRKYAWKLKRRALEKLGGCFCVKCGIIDIRILTINHRDGNGKNDRKPLKSFYLDIIKGRRKTNDLEVRCYNCNILYEYEIGRLLYKVEQ